MIKNYILKCEKYSILVSIMLIILSIFLIGKPMESLETFVIAFAIIMIINGISNFVTYFGSDKEYRLFSFDLIIGILTILAGILVFMYRTSLISIFPIMLGIWIIASNIFKIQIAINLSSIKNSGWGYLLLLAILMIILGVVLIINPFASIITITTLAGIMLLVSEIVSLIESIYLLVKVKKF